MSASSVKGLTVFFAAVGAALMTYLTRLHYLAGDEPAVCDISAELSCDVVNASAYSEILGVPVSVLGLAFFLTVIVLALARNVKRRYWLIAVFATGSLAFSLYLTLIEQFVIGSICIFCELSKLMMVAILALAYEGARKDSDPFTLKHALAAVLAGAILAGASWIIQTPRGPKADYSALTSCLTEKGVVMYGSYICPVCARQKRELGEEAFALATEVECHPRGPNPETARCIERDITKTPTWIQELDGREIKRLVGYQSPETLAAEFGCPLP